MASRLSEGYQFTNLGFCIISLWSQIIKMSTVCSVRRWVTWWLFFKTTEKDVTVLSTVSSCIDIIKKNHIFSPVIVKLIQNMPVTLRFLISPWRIEKKIHRNVLTLCDLGKSCTEKSQSWIHFLTFRNYDLGGTRGVPSLWLQDSLIKIVSTLEKSRRICACKNFIYLPHPRNLKTNTFHCPYYREHVLPRFIYLFRF